jgi:hypothetical protein
MIKQLCECCNEWVDQMDLLWDLEDYTCHDSNVVDK